VNDIQCQGEASSPPKGSSSFSNTYRSCLFFFSESGNVNVGFTFYPFLVHTVQFKSLTKRCCRIFGLGSDHRLNLEFDLQSLFGLHVHSCTWYSLTDTCNPTPTPHLGSYTRALLVSQDRRHLFITPWI
jgi:hypothetical protein